MKIAHINNIANVAWRLAEAQRRLGHEAVVFSLFDTPGEFHHDVWVADAQGPLGFNKAMFSRRRVFAGFDVLHVHGGIWKAQLFYPWFRSRHPRSVLAAHYHGSETRTGTGLYYQHWIDVQFHVTLDLGRYLPRSIWIPNPIELPEPPPDPGNPVPVFIHFGSSRPVKGTPAVIELFQRVFRPDPPRKEGVVTRFASKEAELWVVSGVPHEVAVRIIARSDAVIDQIAPYGGYGVVAIEGMAYGKPVLGKINTEWHGDSPIIPIRPGVEEDLRALAADAPRRAELGNAGREYVRRVHAADKVARRVIDAYTGDKPRGS